MNRLSILTLAGATALICGCGTHGTTSVVPGGRVATPETVDVGFGFRVTFPDTPSKHGTLMEPQTSRWDATWDGIKYTVVNDPPWPVTETNASAQLAFNMFSPNLTAHRVVTAQRDILLRGWAGIEYRGNSRGVYDMGRVYRVGSRMINLLAESSSPEFPPEAERFPESLALPEGTPTGPQSKPGPTFSTFKCSDVEMIAALPSAPRSYIGKVHFGQTATTAIYDRAVYGDRYFVLASAPLPRRWADGLTPSRALSALPDLAKCLFGSAAAKLSSEVRQEKTGLTILTANTTLGTDSGRVWVACSAGRVFGALALVPSAIFPSSEVDQFLASIRITGIRR